MHTSDDEVDDAGHDADPESAMSTDAAIHGVLDYNAMTHTYLVAWEMGSPSWVHASDLENSALAVLTFHGGDCSAVAPELAMHVTAVLPLAKDADLCAEQIPFSEHDATAMLQGQQALTTFVQQAAAQLVDLVRDVSVDVASRAANVVAAVPQMLAQLLALHQAQAATITSRDVYQRLVELLQHDTPLSASDIGENFLALGYLQRDHSNVFLADPCQFNRLLTRLGPNGPLARLAPTAKLSVALPCFHSGATASDIGHWTLLMVRFPGLGQEQYHTELYDSLAGYCKGDHRVALAAYAEFMADTFGVASTVLQSMTNPNGCIKKALQAPNDLTCGVWVMMVVRHVLLDSQEAFVGDPNQLPVMRTIMVLEALFRKNIDWIAPVLAHLNLQICPKVCMHVCVCVCLLVCALYVFWAKRKQISELWNVFYKILFHFHTTFFISKQYLSCFR